MQKQISVQKVKIYKRSSYYLDKLSFWHLKKKVYCLKNFFKFKQLLYNFCFWKSRNPQKKVRFFFFYKQRKSIAWFNQHKRLTYFTRALKHFYIQLLWIKFLQLLNNQINIPYSLTKTHLFDIKFKKIRGINKKNKCLFFFQKLFSHLVAKRTNLSIMIRRKVFLFFYIYFKTYPLRKLLLFLTVLNTWKLDFLTYMRLQKLILFFKKFFYYLGLNWSFLYSKWQTAKSKVKFSKKGYNDKPSFKFGRSFNKSKRNVLKKDLHRFLKSFNRHNRHNRSNKYNNDYLSLFKKIKIKRNYFCRQRKALTKYFTKTALRSEMLYFSSRSVVFTRLFKLQNRRGKSIFKYIKPPIHYFKFNKILFNNPLTPLQTKKFQKRWKIKWTRQICQKFNFQRGYVTSSIFFKKLNIFLCTFSQRQQTKFVCSFGSINIKSKKKKKAKESFEQLCDFFINKCHQLTITQFDILYVYVPLKKTWRIRKCVKYLVRVLQTAYISCYKIKFVITPAHSLPLRTKKKKRL